MPEFSFRPHTPPLKLMPKDSTSSGSSANDDSHRKPPAPARKSIYPHPSLSGHWYVNITQSSSNWPTQYTQIQNHLRHLFSTSSPPAPYLTINHIGSTCIPFLPSKPNIDVLVTFSSEDNLNRAIEALNWEIPTAPPYAKYTQVIPRGGGIPGRESFKIYLPEDNCYYSTTPEINLYLIADVAENKAGQIQIRVHRTFKEVLLDERHADLLKSYGELKWRLAGESFKTPIEYTARKNGAIREILRRGGWTDEEVDEKEKLTQREWIVDQEEAPY